MRLNPVSISLSSFGADAVRQSGQESFLQLLAAAGVSRVEFREELFDGAPDTAALRSATAALDLECLFSSPLELWTEQGTLNPLLPQKLALASRLGAVALKVSLGHYQPRCEVSALRALVAAGSPRLLVENDQTVQGGRIAPLLGFFERVEALELPVGMTFDIGNWHWQDESAIRAARMFGRWVQYVHCKAVERQPSGRLVAVRPRAADLMAWAALLGEFTPGVVRAVEYPLVDDDLLALTRAQVNNLARLGLGEEVSHV
ncbi:sugar phosphate isomerase/epimerase family protein [Pseudomonas vanderleydeniana]|uniref:AP endonuclease n=1 Tax=Pseudomonas vanderleydeniana TaxID=2745495 RepID=A0A9E6TUL2_9PSED|nr:AP endonuclease [Pseudomonas vanderleydeniana]QXI30959.1 AP endonuclease [Pseudomonas vanderleydeniana]